MQSCIALVDCSSQAHLCNLCWHAALSVDTNEDMGIIYILIKLLITFADSRSGDLKLTPQWRHGAVPEEDVVWVYTYMNKNNVSFLTALHALHKKLFPSGYTPYPFKTGKI